MKNGLKAISLCSGAALALVACGDDPQAANAANFEEALNAHYAVMKQCVEIGGEPNEDGIIQEFRMETSAEDKDFSFYNGLAGLGLLEAASYHKVTKSFSGQIMGKAEWVGFKFSDLGNSYLRPAELDDGFSSTGARQLCYGTPQVVEIINFTEPAETMGVTASSVHYTYKLVDVAPWASEPVLTTRFAWLTERIKNQSIEKDDDLILTLNGWTHHSNLN